MDAYVGQIILVPYTFAPRSWAFCQGQLLPISQNTALFSLLGTQFGGDGRSSFGLPNLQGSIPLGAGTSPGQPTYVVGQTGGSANVTLQLAQMPMHTHQHEGVAVASVKVATANMFGDAPRGGTNKYYVPAPVAGSTALMNQAALQPSQGGQPHSNMMSTLVMNYIICLQGIFPERP